MKRSDLKPGMVFRVKKDLKPNAMNGVGFVNCDMTTYETVTIKMVNGFNTTHDFQSCEGSWFWLLDWVEPLDTRQELVDRLEEARKAAEEAERALKEFDNTPKYKVGDEGGWGSIQATILAVTPEGYLYSYCGPGMTGVRGMDRVNFETRFQKRA